MILFVLSIMLLVVGAVFGAPGQRQNMMRLARGGDQHLSGGDVVRSLMATRSLDKIGGGELLKALDPHTGGQIFRSLDRAHLLDSLDGFQGGEVVRMLDAITGGDLLSSLDSAEGTAVLGALRRTAPHPHPKRMLDSVSGWAFGESKRNFDEIDNVGFTGFAKRGRGHSSLAKRNFDEIDRAGFETYNKRNFDEIDRTGFETFEKKGGQ